MQWKIYNTCFSSHFYLKFLIDYLQPDHLTISIIRGDIIYALVWKFNNQMGETDPFKIS